MSYETYSLADTVWVFDMSAEDGLDNNYQLDGGLHTATVGYYTGAANVFYVSEKEGVASETLKSVSLSFTQTADVGYTIDIYTDLKDATNPLTGLSMLRRVQVEEQLLQEYIPFLLRRRLF